MNMQTSTDRNLNFDFVRRQVEQPPAWASEVLLSWEEAYPQEKHAFLQSHYWTETGSINVFRVVGTDRKDYRGRSWLDFLTGGKRMQRNLQALLDNPSYYLQPTERRPAIHYNTLDGLNFYVGSDGNHRTCIARFFLAEQQKSQLHDGRSTTTRSTTPSTACTGNSGNRSCYKGCLYKFIRSACSWVGKILQAGRWTPTRPH
ncbi:TPA: hypothetical protein ACUT80_002736 [Pseudomonas aeruginosa]